jgi:predicted transcriptional regulator
MHLGTKRGRAPEIGALELHVLKILWAAAEAMDARAVLAELAERPISLSTVQATLERLHRKGLLSRTKVGRAYYYAATVSRERLIGSLIRDVALRFAEGKLEPVISGFVEFLGEADPELLDRVESSTAEFRRKERE